MVTNSDLLKLVHKVESVFLNVHDDIACRDESLRYRQKKFNPTVDDAVLLLIAKVRTYIKIRELNKQFLYVLQEKRNERKNKELKNDVQ